MRLVASYTVALLASSSLVAGEVDIVPPKQTTLRLAHVATKESTAKYTGYVDVTGTLVAEWHDGEVEAGEKIAPTMGYTVLLDEKSQSELPHFDKYNITSIAPANGPSALAMAAGRAVLAAFRAHKIARVEVKGKYTVSNLEIGVECDTPWARAHIDRVGNHAPPKITYTQNMEGCSPSISTVEVN